MKNLYLLLSAILFTNVSASDFILLSKSDIQGFDASYASIQDAFREQNLPPIASFGPSILSKYSAILLQSEPFAKNKRLDYKRLDSLVAYAIVRIQIDSILNFAQTRGKTNIELETILSVDKTIAVLEPGTSLYQIDGSYCDSTRIQSQEYLEKAIPAFIKVMKSKGQENNAYKVLKGLAFDSKVLRVETKNLELGVDKEYKAILSAYDKNLVLAFRDKYPTYKPEKIQERLNSLEADEIYHLLKEGDKQSLIQFLEANPASEYVPEIQKKLEPQLLKLSLVEYDLPSCKIYLALFPPNTENWKNVSETLGWITSPAMDSVIQEPARIVSRQDSKLEPAGPEDDDQDGPRTEPPILGVTSK